MIKAWAFIRIVLTVLLIGFPIILIIFFLSKRFQNVLLNVYLRVRHLSILKKFKNDILLRGRKPWAVPAGEEPSHDVQFTQEDIVVVEKQEVDVVQNIIQAPAQDIPVPEQKEVVLDRELFLKNKKLLEKIVYEALVLRKEGRLDDYEKKLIEGLALDPNDKDLNRFLADYYFSISNHKKALSLLKKIVELDPRDHKAIRQIGEIYLSSGDFETAELLIEKAITINPANPKYYISMVELYYNTDRKTDAIEQLEQVVKLRPTNPSYMLTLADLYMEIGDTENAQKYYFRVLEHEPTNEKAKKRLKELIQE